MTSTLIWVWTRIVRACSPIMQRWFLSAIALSLLAIFALPAQAADPWPTTRFQVFAGNPFAENTNIDVDWFEFEEHVFGLDEDVRNDIERAFQEAAQWYQQRGFPPPVLEPMVDTEDGPAYRVYVCSRDWDQKAYAWIAGENGSFAGLEWHECGWNPRTNNTSLGLYVPDCPQVPGRSKFMVVNSDSSVGANGKLNEEGYQTIAHELMHAIVASMPFRRSDPGCKATGWIGEGIADAISIDLAEDLWKGRYRESNSNGAVFKRYGYRPYLERLPQAGSVPVPNSSGTVPAKYTTSSFWRYIADAHPNKWKVLVTQEIPGATAPPGLLDVPLEGTGWRNEVNWLNMGLRNQFNLRLRDIYGLFVNYLPYQIAPLNHYNNKSAQDSLEHWVGLLFGNCESVDLTSASTKTFTLDIKGLASACIWVEPTNAPGLVQITFQSANDDLDLLQAISIGRSGTALLSRAAPIAQTPNGPSLYMASWRDYPQDGSKRTLYVVSNVAAEPGDSEARQVTFTAALPDNKNSARNNSSLPPRRVAQPPQKPTYNKHAPSLAQQKSKTAKMVQEQINLDKKTLNPNVSNSTIMTRRIKQPDCLEPFRYTPCGPHLSISLSLLPGTYASLGATSSQGGGAGQILGGLQAMAATSSADNSDNLHYLAELTKGIDGHHVSIVIPLMDYGETGSFSNAAIGVAMSNERSYSAIGPLDGNDLPPLTGQVTIEEYSAFLIRGSFSAPLAEFLPGAGPNDPLIFTPRGTVSGTFTSVAPWLGDERITLIPDSQDQMTEDALNALGLPAGMIYSMKQNGQMPGSKGSGSAPGSSAASDFLSGDCTCECAMKPQADELCELMCEEEFAACPDP